MAKSNLPPLEPGQEVTFHPCVTKVTGGATGGRIMFAKPRNMYAIMSRYPDGSLASWNVRRGYLTLAE